MSLIRITCGKNAGSISCCSGEIPAIPQENSERRALLRVANKAQSIRAIYLDPEDPSVQQTIYLGKSSERYEPMSQSEGKKVFCDPHEYVTHGSGHEEVREVVDAFLRDPMTKGVVVKTEAESYYFTKNQFSELYQ